MSVLCPTVIEASNLSTAWTRLLLLTIDRSKSALAPAVVSIAGFSGDLPDETPDVRKAVDAELARQSMNPVRVSALTIFPCQMWLRRGRPDVKVFRELCIKGLLPRLKQRDSRNQNGTYFGRMMEFDGSKKGKPQSVDQLSFVIGLLRKRTKWPRESALQLAVFDPVKDHTGQPVRGFPCLQQVGLSLDGQGAFALSAYYPTQYVFDRAYGNYLGLCQLAAFIAHQTELRFVRLNCFVGRPDLGATTKIKLRSLVDVIKPHA